MFYNTCISNTFNTMHTSISASVLSSLSYQTRFLQIHELQNTFVKMQKRIGSIYINVVQNVGQGDPICVCDF